MYTEHAALASALRNSNGNLTFDTMGGSFEGNRAAGSRFFLDVTAMAGTNPTLDVVLTAVVNGIEFTLASFAQKTGVSKEVVSVADCPRFVKAAWTIGGTASPSFTFSLGNTRL